MRPSKRPVHKRSRLAQPKSRRAIILNAAVARSPHLVGFRGVRPPPIRQRSPDCAQKGRSRSPTSSSIVAHSEFLSFIYFA
jgi:hypothetical protein